jgi:hypothetical protein
MPLTVQKRTTITTTYPAVCPAVTVLEDPVYVRPTFLSTPVIEETITTFPPMVIEPWDSGVIVEEAPLNIFDPVPAFQQFQGFNSYDQPAQQLNMGNARNAVNQFDVANKYHPADVLSTNETVSDADPYTMLGGQMRTRNLSGGTQWDYNVNADNESLIDPMRRLSAATDYSTATAHFEDQREHFPQHMNQLTGQSLMSQRIPQQLNQQLGQQSFSQGNHQLFNSSFNQEGQQLFNQQLYNQGNQQLFNQPLNLTPQLGQSFHNGAQQSIQPHTDALITDIPLLESGATQLVNDSLPWEKQAVLSDNRHVMNWERPMMMSTQMSRSGSNQSSLPREPELPASSFHYTSVKPFTDIIHL